ncbi:MAG: CpsB/CapC family capsule biosynthesis tyrosine phosphatase, partial [Bacteroidota bacterium]
MFTIFSKKSFLIDHISGLVDIHNHVLPGIDDGAQTVDESLEMVKMFQEFGINELICTPHIMHNYYDNTPKTIEQAYHKLSESLIAENVQAVTLKYAAEHMIDDDFEHKLEESHIVPLNENHLLIEMSYLQPSINFDSAVDKIIKSGFFPVFALAAPSPSSLASRSYAFAGSSLSSSR